MCVCFGEARACVRVSGGGTGGCACSRSGCVACGDRSEQRHCHVCTYTHTCGSLRAGGDPVRDVGKRVGVGWGSGPRNPEVKQRSHLPLRQEHELHLEPA